MFITALILAATLDASLVTRLQKPADATELRAIARELATHEQTSLTRYTLAYVNRKLAFTKSADRRALLAEAAALLEQNDDAESHALLGSVYGAMIGVEPARGPELGAKARRELAKALELAPHNPRVHLLLGTSAFHRPVEYGGGPAVAERHLRRAIELFQQEPEAKPWPNWGRAEAYGYLERTAKQLQRR
ncbi:MAG TPA: hypothetical protein VGF28_25295 [Thermoanaerobaculia bacterium]|jgi:Flp pilus assembly protein TadD